MPRAEVSARRWAKRPHKRTGLTTPAAAWAVPGEEAKTGAGVLFFAYGSDPKALQHFLTEATVAARSFRVHNPNLPLAIVSNNASVDRQVHTDRSARSHTAAEPSLR